MRLNKMLIPVGALAMTLTAGGFSAEAAQRGDRRGGDGQSSQGQARERSAGPRNDGAAREQRDNSRDQRNNNARDSRDDRRDPRGDVRDNRGVVRDNRNDYRGDIRQGRAIPRQYGRPDGYRYYAPRIVPRGYAPRHYYGSGGHLSVYFGLGSGYLYGSPYSGRVYGYSRGPSAYGARRYFGDVRLQIRPRGAAVYVDGYYAGIVDDFDGVFQRLTLDVGPHQIEIEAPGLESQLFDVYVDPSRTVDLHGDLYPGRP